MWIREWRTCAKGRGEKEKEIGLRCCFQCKSILQTHILAATILLTIGPASGRSTEQGWQQALYNHFQINRFFLRSYYQSSRCTLGWIPWHLFLTYKHSSFIGCNLRRGWVIELIKDRTLLIFFLTSTEVMLCARSFANLCHLTSQPACALFHILNVRVPI